MFPLPHATTATMTLDAVFARLRQHPAVDGILTIGTTLQSTLTPTSDYDIVIVLNEMPLPLHVGITSIDHRLTDLLFATTAQVAEILATTVPIESEAWIGRIARWLAAGQIVFDRHGHLQLAQEKVLSGTWIRPFDTIDSYGAWIGVNYNLLHTRRLLQSNDPIYQYAAELRMSLYGVGSIIVSYFRVRNLPWEGDKAAIRYLVAHDQPFFLLLQTFLRTADPSAKMEAYEQLAAATLAPIAPLWTGEPTVFWYDLQPNTWETIADGLAFWETLLTGDTHERTAPE